MNDFERKLYEIIKNSTPYFDRNGKPFEKLLEDYAVRSASDLLRIAFEKKEEIRPDVSDEDLLDMWNNRMQVQACRQYAEKYGCSLGEARRSLYKLAGQIPPENR